MLKLNCWEFKKCGRQAEGANQESKGLCPATGEIRLDGIHDGISAGRTCWIVAGTYAKCEGCCTYIKDLKDCTECDFYKAVQSEEGDDFLSLEDIKEVLG